MKKILIVIDMQNDFIDGVLRSKEAINVVNKVCEKFNKSENEYDQIFFTQDTHIDGSDCTIEEKTIPAHCIKETNGWYINKDISHFVNNSKVKIVEKNIFGFVEWEKYIDAAPAVIEVCGLCTDICVISNALILRSLYPCAKIICDASCCAGTSPKMHEAALDVMESCLIDVINKGE